MKRYIRSIAAALIIVLLCSFISSCSENTNESDEHILLLSSGVIRLDKVGMTHQLQVISNNSEIEVTWTSSAPEIATVSESGLVTSVNKGSAVISATTQDGAVAYCTVNVLRAPPKLEEVFNVEIVGAPKTVEYYSKQTGAHLCTYVINSLDIHEYYLQDGVYYVQLKFKGVKTYDSSSDGTYPVIVKFNLYNEYDVFCESQLLKSENVTVGEEFEVLCTWFGVRIIDDTVRDFEIRLEEKIEN